MLYILYLIGTVSMVVAGIGVSHLLSFTDGVTLFFVLIPCALILIFTRSIKSFGRSFLFIFGKKNYSLEQYKESMQSVKMVMLTAMLFGSLGFMIGIVNSFRSSKILSPDMAHTIVLDISVALLSLFYAVCVCVILLPVYFMLKKQS